MRTNVIFATICCVLFSVTASQAQDVSPKLNAALSQEEISVMDNSQLAEFSFYADHGFTVHASGKENMSYPLLSEFLKEGKTVQYEEINLESFNPLLFNFPDRTDHQFYRVDGTEAVVQIFSADYCSMRYEQYQVNAANKLKNKK